MKMFNKPKHNNQAGFTLVELSIVLVIIGLIISSVLVGQDLVRSAELRATITQLEGFNAAVGTFKGKYNGLPGDVAGAASFGFEVDGNGDGTLDSSTSLAGDSTGSIGENVGFWNHLGSSSSALISGSYLGVAIDATGSNIASILPAAKAGNYWGVYSDLGVNYYAIGVVAGPADAAKYVSAVTLTPLEAKNIDDKIDDGRPGRGIVQAKGAALTTVNNLEVAPSTSTCVSAATAAGTYTTTLAPAGCNLRIKMPY